MKKRSKPKFHRQRSHFYKRLRRKGWRTPRGKDSLQRRGKLSRGACPNVGYRQPRAVRGLHPCGLSETLVFTPTQIEKIDAKKTAVRIGATVGKKKRLQIVQKARAAGVKILNPGMPNGSKTN